MNVLITGGAGFIGSHLVDLHMAKGHHVAVLDDLSTGNLDNISQHSGKQGSRYIEDSVVDWDGLPEAIDKADIIYHMAAVVGVKHVLENPADVISVNLSATDRLINTMAARKSDVPVIIASSSEVYGFSKKRVFTEEDDVVLPSTDRLRYCYAVTKLADEMMAFAAHHQHGLKTVTVRLFNTVGSRQKARYGMVLPHFIEEALSGNPLTVYGSGKQSRSLCDVRDTVRMLYELSGQEKAWGEVVNVGTNHEITINDLATLVKNRAMSTSTIAHIDYKDAYGMDFRDIGHRRPDLTRLCSLIKFRPEFTLKDTIDNLIEMYRMEKNIRQTPAGST
ncbi:MAG TPA: NAD-dependent epimerase/dehydratase family protein [Gammaproteobacteria bacterium]|nr:NAD-dependent epimerase/dehydratase family protein [Gammaproteobacteria bacterium]